MNRPDRGGEYDPLHEANLSQSLKPFYTNSVEFDRTGDCKLGYSALSSDTSPTLQDRLSLSSQNSASTVLTLVNIDNSGNQSLQQPKLQYQQHQHLFKTATGTLTLADISMAPSESSLSLLSRHLAEQSNQHYASDRSDPRAHLAPLTFDTAPHLECSASPSSSCPSTQAPLPAMSETSFAPSCHSQTPRTQSVFLPPLAATPTLTPSAQSLFGLARHEGSVGGGSAHGSTSFERHVGESRHHADGGRPTLMMNYGAAGSMISSDNSPQVPRRTSRRKRTRRQFSEHIVVGEELEQLEELDEDFDRQTATEYEGVGFPGRTPATAVAGTTLSRRGLKGKAKKSMSSTGLSTTSPAAADRPKVSTGREAALERNRQAAVRSRQKRKSQVEGLERGECDLSL
jgi:hypothetical protein